MGSKLPLDSQGCCFARLAEGLTGLCHAESKSVVTLPWYSQSCDDTFCKGGRLARSLCRICACHSRCATVSWTLCRLRQMGGLRPESRERLHQNSSHLCLASMPWETVGETSLLCPGPGTMAWHSQMSPRAMMCPAGSSALRMQVTLLLASPYSDCCVPCHTAHAAVPHCSCLCPAGCSANPDKPLPALAQVRPESLLRRQDTQHHDTASHVVLRAPWLGLLNSRAACVAAIRHCTHFSALYNTTQA